MHHKTSKTPTRPTTKVPTLLLIGLVCALALPSLATIRSVTTTADSGPGSLRDTIAASAPGDTIGFSGFAFVRTARILLTSGELLIAKDLTIDGASRVLIDGNRAGRVFNITSGTVTLSGLTITNGLASGNDGAGLLNKGTLTVNNCIFANSSAQFGGGIYNEGTLTVNYCTFSGNTATTDGGGLLNSTSARVTVANSVFFSNNAGYNGAGIYNEGTLTVSECTFSLNYATGVGGGIEATGGGTGTVNNTTFYANVATDGGGIANYYTLSVKNSTFSGNSVGHHGGGIFNYGTLTVNHCTLADNTSNIGGGIAADAGTTTIQNTIIDRNLAAGVHMDVVGTFTSQGFNLIAVTNGSSGWIAGDLTGSTANPRYANLGVLQQNGGPTETIEPNPGSPAIDGGTSGGLTTDQRGQPRRFDNFLISNVTGGDGSDIGSFEWQGPVITSQPQPASQIVAAGQSVTWSVVVSGGNVPSYQWRKDGSDIAGATSSSYTRNNVQPADIGNYSVVVTDYNSTSAGSAPAFLNVGFTLTRNVNGSGTIVARPDQTLYTNNQIVTLNPVPASGWLFSKWSGDLAGNARPTSVIMTAHKSVTANFASATHTNHVTNLNDSGAGSLRAAIAASVPGDTIDFPGLMGTLLLTNGELAINSDLTIIGAGQTNLIISGKGAGSGLRVFNIGAVRASISDLTIANGYALDAPGGGIYNAGTLVLENCGFTNNAVWEASGGGQVYGGAIYNSGGVISANHCNFSGNVAAASTRGSSPAGGAIYNNGGSVSLQSSSFSGNLVHNVQNLPCYGGALHNAGGTMWLNNCTMATNSIRNLASQSVAYGGAIFNAGSLSISNSTLAGNSSSAFTLDAGGAIYQSAGTLSIQSSIVSYNSSRSGPDVYGVITSQGFNLISRTNGSRGWLSTDLTGSTNSPVDPLLAALTNNGGPTLTMALLPGSPAIDQGYSGAKTDQRGAARRFDNLSYPNPAGGDGSDIGAYEAGLSLTVNIFGGGIVLRNPDLPAYAYNQQVTLTAIPASGWNFGNWSAEASGTANPITVTMTGDKFVTASFAASGGACAPAPSGLVGWWPGAGDGNDLLSLNAGRLEGMAFGPGRVGRAFSFDGSTSDVLLPPRPELQFRTQFTLEAWIYPLDVGNYRQIFSAFRDAPYRQWHYQMGLSPNGALRMDVSGNNSTYDYLVSANGVLAPNTWSHVAATFNGGLMSLYVNGALVASKYSSVSTIYYYANDPAYPESILMGSTPQANQRFYGLIDEMSAYNRALAQSEIQAIANAGSAGKCTTPVCLTGLSKSGNNVNLSWLAQRGVAYRPEYKTDLNPAAPWVSLGDIPATSGTANKSDTPSATEAQRFYRVEMLR